jgi:hypothetical protein
MTGNGGLGIHLGHCDEAPGDISDLKSELMSSDSAPHSGRERPEEEKEKISQLMSEIAESVGGREYFDKRIGDDRFNPESGWKHPNHHGGDSIPDELPKSWKESISDGMGDFDPEPPDSTDPEIRQKISQGVKKALDDRGEPFNTQKREIPTACGYSVMSEWERRVSDSLYWMGVPHKFEEVSLDIQEMGQYYPDFVLPNDTLIEVKGPYIRDEKVANRKGSVGKWESDHFIVIGNQEFPNDHHIDYTEEMVELCDRIQNALIRIGLM